MKLSKLAFLALLITIITSCESADDNMVQPQSVPLGAYENGIIVNGEGGFNNGNAYVSYISNDLSVTENTIFNNVNNEPLGDLSQSITLAGELAYIVVNNSKKIEVVNRYSFESVATIDSDLVNPRHIAISNEKGYVTDWGDGTDATDDYIAVLNLETYTVEATIPVGEGPEQILEKNGKLYVSQKGGYNINNKITVIDTSDNSISTIAINDVPDEMFFDNNGNLVVLCEGENKYWETPPSETDASITKINLNDNSVSSNLVFTTGEHPNLMTYENGTIYYVLNNKLYSFQDTNTSLPASSILNLGDKTYGLSIKENRIYATNANFSGPENNNLLIYDLNLGVEIKKIDLPLGPSKIYFN